MLLVLLMPVENSKGMECVPAAWLADGFCQRKCEGFGVGIVEEPAAVGLAFGFDELNGFGETWVGHGFCVDASGAEVIEGAENVVVVARRESEFEEFGACNFAGGSAAEERALEEIFFGATAGRGDFCCLWLVCVVRLRFG